MVQIKNLSGMKYKAMFDYDKTSMARGLTVTKDQMNFVWRCRAGFMWNFEMKIGELEFKRGKR